MQLVAFSTFGVSKSNMMTSSISAISFWQYQIHQEKSAIRGGTQISFDNFTVLYNTWSFATSMIRTHKCRSSWKMLFEKVLASYPLDDS